MSGAFSEPPLKPASPKAGWGLTPGAARALLHVAALDGPRQTALAERLGIEPMTVSSYIDRLEAAGLVERRPDPFDRRAKCVFLTEQAAGTVDHVRALARSVLDEALAGVSAEDRQAFEAVLRQAHSRLQALSRDRDDATAPRENAA
jgi:MarR family transcriptional regulator for hemolysin